MGSGGFLFIIPTVHICGRSPPSNLKFRRRLIVITECVALSLAVGQPPLLPAMAVSEVAYSRLSASHGKSPACSSFLHLLLQAREPSSIGTGPVLPTDRVADGGQRLCYGTVPSRHSTASRVATTHARAPSHRACVCLCLCVSVCARARARARLRVRMYLACMRPLLSGTAGRDLQRLDVRVNGLDVLREGRLHLLEQLRVLLERLRERMLLLLDRRHLAPWHVAAGCLAARPVATGCHPEPLRWRACCRLLYQRVL